MIADRKDWAIWDCDPQVTIYSYRNEGLVSIDYLKRAWEPGGSRFVKSMPGRYAGRGWRERLEADAVAHLEKIFKD